MSETTRSIGTSSRRDMLALSLGVGALSACRATRAPVAPTGAAHADPFDELRDERAGLAPISSVERKARRVRLGTLLARRGLDAFVCEGGATMSYLSGISWGKSERTFALVVTADGAHFWMCPAFEAEKARLSINTDDGPAGEIVEWAEHEYAWKPMAAALRARRAERVAVDPTARFFIAESLRAELGGERVVFGREIVTELRGVKDAHELALLRRANELTQRAIIATSQRVELGMNGSAVAALMDAAHRKLGMSGAWCLALVGPAAAYPHGENHDVVIGRGDFLLVDTGASLHGYQSDTTRTWCVAGAPDAARMKAWNAVRSAQQRAFDALKPGVLCRDIDRIARASLAADGFGGAYEHLTHRLGHGIGVEGHEDPYFDGGNETVLAPGMTLSNEPGVYVLGKYGVRLEDIVQVTESGADHYGRWQGAPTSPE